MESSDVIGVVLVLFGLVLLYLLRGVLFQLIVLVLGFLGVVIAVVLVFGGLAMILWPRRRWW
ncbi:MAG TPA: hypothetical protein VLX56_02325 [Nitrososphaerales archaeon]|nr:hypothetical protein [Nitrososphaerales archaeon]